MIKYIEGGTVLITDMLASECRGHKGTAIDTLIVTRRVWEDAESRMCLQPMLCIADKKAKIIIVNNDGKFEIF